jgi:DNA-binding GntR family transcriptional regulator
MRLPYSRHKDLMEIHAEHSKVIELVKQGDREGALEALKANIH